MAHINLDTLFLYSDHFFPGFLTTAKRRTMNQILSTGRPRLWVFATIAAGIVLICSLLFWHYDVRRRPPASLDFLADGADAMQEFDFERAYRSFHQVVDSESAGSPRWQNAVFASAVACQAITPETRSNMDDAIALYHLLLSTSPDSQFAPTAILNLGRIAELGEMFGDAPDFTAARGDYQQVIQRWPNDSIAGEATLRLAATYIQTYQPDQVRTGLAMLESWLKSHPADPLAPVIWQYMGDTNFLALQDYSDSLNCYLKADALGLVDPTKAGPIYWRMAVLADRYVHNRSVAIAYYRKLIVTAPWDGKAYEAAQALRHLGISQPPSSPVASSSVSIHPEIQ
jgi:tetratricopeptide (TPR) repeat protein